MNSTQRLLAGLILVLAIFSFKAFQSYSFDTEVIMEMKEYNGDDLKNNSDIKFYSSNKHGNLAYVMDVNTHGQSLSAQIVHDAKSNTMTTLINQGGMKMAMQYDITKMEGGIGGMASEAGQKDMSNAQFKKTGRTKKILGYTCHEYEIVDDKSYGLTWMAEDLDVSSFYSAFSKIKGMGKNFNTDMPAGFPMEINSWPNGKGTDEKYVIEVTAINKNKKSSISTDGYNIMKLN